MLVIILLEDVAIVLRHRNDVTENGTGGSSRGQVSEHI